jgi:hypothetical protein
MWPHVYVICVCLVFLFVGDLLLCLASTKVNIIIFLRFDCGNFTRQKVRHKGLNTLGKDEINLLLTVAGTNVNIYYITDQNIGANMNIYEGQDMRDIKTTDKAG